MSRISLHRPRRPRAVWDRPATGTRLLPIPHSLNPHYKRCPKAERLRLRSDQSLSHPVPVTGYGRFPDKNRLALSKGPCQVRPPLTRRIILAPSGDAHEHGVKPLNRAIVPRDSTVVAFGELIPPSDGNESTPPYLRMVGPLLVVETAPNPRFPRVSSTSLSEARGCRRVVADVEHPLWRTTRNRCRRRRLPAQPSGTFHPPPLLPRRSGSRTAQLTPLTPSHERNPPPTNNPLLTL